MVRVTLNDIVMLCAIIGAPQILIARDGDAKENWTSAYLNARIEKWAVERNKDSGVPNVAFRVSAALVALTRPEAWLLSQEIIVPTRTADNIPMGFTIDGGREVLSISVITGAFERARRESLTQEIMSEPNDIVVFLPDIGGEQPTAVTVVRKPAKKQDGTLGLIEIQKFAIFKEQVDEDGDGMWDAESCWQVVYEEVSFVDRNSTKILIKKGSKPK